MRWFKVAAIAGGILIAFLVVGSVIGFIIHAVLGLVVAALVAGVVTSRPRTWTRHLERDPFVMMTAGLVLVTVASSAAARHLSGAVGTVTLLLVLTAVAIVVKAMPGTP